MSLNGGGYFEVFHGTQAEAHDLRAGLSGKENYQNLGLDPFSAFGYTKSELPGHYIRMSVWNVLPEEIKPKYDLKWASIKRPFTAVEKERHMMTFRRVMESSRELPVAKKWNDRKEIIEREKERQNGIPGERLSMIIEFTINQRNKLSKEPISFKAMMLQLVDNGKKPYSLEELEERFLASCPDLDKMRVYDASGMLQDLSETKKVLLKLYRQSLLTTAHSMRLGDKLSFDTNDLYDMKTNGFLEKDDDYYRSRDRGYEVWLGVREMAMNYEDEILRRYPELAVVIGRS